MTYYIMPDINTRRAAFATGDIEVALLPYDQIPDLVNWTEGQLEVTDDNITDTLIYNLNDAATGDSRFRQALYLALDRQTIVNQLYGEIPRPGGNLEVAQGLYPPNVLGGEDFSVPYDPETANALLDEAGFSERDAEGFRLYPNGDPLDLEVLVPPSSPKQFIAEVMQQNLSDVGIRTSINVADGTAYFQRLADCATQVALITSQVQYNDLDGGMRGLFNSLQACGYGDGATEQTLSFLNEAASLPVGSANQIELYRQADQVAVTEDSVLAPILYGGFGLYVQPGLPDPSSSWWWCRYCWWC